jgi:hypothetical protein
LSLDKSDIDLFKTKILPNLKHLHTLLLLKGPYTDSMPPRVSFTAALPAQIGAVAEAGPKPLFGPVGPPVPKPGPKTAEEIKEARREAEIVAEEVRVQLTKSLFKVSWESWGKKNREEERHKAEIFWAWISHLCLYVARPRREREHFSGCQTTI